MSVITLALAAKTIAPATGRTMVWITSLTWFTAGTLSAKNSTSVNTINKPITHQLVSVSQGEFNWIKSVKRATMAITSNGIYALSPALAESPNAGLNAYIPLLV